jgi:hypothetical protein
VAFKRSSRAFFLLLLKADREMVCVFDGYK